LEVTLSITIRIEGERSLIERIRNALLPDFISTILDDNVEIRGRKAVWKINLAAETISRLRAITNSMLRAISLAIEIENILEGMEKDLNNKLNK